MDASQSLLPATTNTCAYCRGVAANGTAILDVEGWRCQLCQLRSEIAVHEGADEQFGSIDKRAMELKAHRATVRTALAGAASVVSLVVGGYVLSLPIDEGGDVFFPVLFVMSSLAIFGYEAFALRRIRNALRRMALPAASIVQR